MARVTEIRFVGYGVPDIEAERAFYAQKWGLREAVTVDGMFYFAAEGSDEPYVVRLRTALEQRIDVIGMAADSAADTDALFAKVSEAGCRIIFAPTALASPGGGYGFRFFSPDGLPFEVSSDVARGPKRDLARWEGIPQKISHIVMHSPNHKAATQFFIDVLGFRLSDWLGDFMSFLRCNEWHHRLAFMPGPACFNHIAYDMPSIDDLMRGISRLKTEGIDIAWGPGRHTAGNNAFGYFVTPGGFAVEYTADLEKVSEDSWQPAVHTPGPQTIDQWGIGVGGPHTMPHPHADPCLFKPAEV